MHACTANGNIRCSVIPAADILSAALGAALEGDGLLGYDAQAGGAAMAGHWRCECC